MRTRSEIREAKRRSLSLIAENENFELGGWCVKSQNDPCRFCKERYYNLYQLRPEVSPSGERFMVRTRSSLVCIRCSEVKLLSLDKYSPLAQYMRDVSVTSVMEE